MPEIGAGEQRYDEALVSARWDIAGAPAPHTRYVLFAQMRTGSELLCADLRQRGLGVPHEYFQSKMMPSLAQRLGAVEPSGRIEFGRYLALVQAKRTTANGVFGTKLLAAQLKRLSGGKVDIAAGLMGRWDKIVLLRRRDTLMQAISLVRSLINGQWHLIGDDRMAPIDCADEILFGRITHCWAQVIDEDRYMQAVIARLDPQRMWAAWYEDLGDERVRQALAQWLGDKTGGAALPPPTENPWPKKADAAEAEAMRRRYLAYIGALGMAPAG